MTALRQILRSALNSLGFDIVKLRNSHLDIATHLRNVLELNEIDCVIDVGANKGQYGQMLRRLGFRGHIESFEPVRAVYEELKRNANQDAKWTCHHCALGDKAELKTINVYSSSVFSSFLEANRYSKNIWKSLEGVEPEEVRVARLDTLFPEIVKRTSCRNLLLKMDTQGYDQNVFSGASGILEAVKLLQTELSLIAVYKGMGKPYDLLNEFHNRNFEISGMYPINRDSKSLAVIEYDCILVRHTTENEA